MASDENYLHYERRWLNLKHGRAFSICSISTYGEDRWINVYAELGDCDRAITLDFSYDIKNAKDYQKQLLKLSHLIQSLETLKTQMANYYDKLRKTK
jgi:hypothetical protein